MRTPREQFAATTADLLDEDPRVALVWAEISGRYFGDMTRTHSERVVNVGIREQLLVSVGAGMALTGMRPVMHTISAFLVERAFEQVKLDFAHQDVGGVLVGVGGSYDVSAGGRTHQSPGDVALMDTLPAVHIHAPGTAQETDAALRRAVADGGLHYVRVGEQVNVASYPLDGRLHVVRHGDGPVVVAFGPMLDPVLEATVGMDVGVLHCNTVRPFDGAGLRAALPRGGTAEIVLVEPWLSGTSARVVGEALQDVPHRLLGLGVPRRELRRYGSPSEHAAAYGLDPAGIRRSIAAFAR